MKPEFDIVEATALDRKFPIKIHHSELLSNIIREKGHYSTYDVEVLKKFLKPGSTFIDIGANIGWYSMIGAWLVGDTGKVYSFEPEPNNARCLRENLELNNLKNVTVIEKAVGEKSGTEKLFLSAENFGDHFVGEFGVPGSSRTTIDIEKVNFDSYFSEDEFKNVGLLKIDIQGSEPKAFRGMKNLIKKFRPPILVEFSPSHIYQCGSSPFEIFAFVEKNGYRPYLVRDEVSDKWSDVAVPLSVEDLFKFTGDLRQQNYGIDLLLIPSKQNTRDIETKFGEAINKFTNHHYDDAERILNELIVDVPEWIEPQTTLALVYEARGNWDEAARRLRQSIMQSPSNPEAGKFAQYKLGWHVIREGDFRTGMQMLRLGRETRVWGAYSVAPKAPRLEPRSPLVGKKVLVLGESGLGDEMVNFRFCKTLQERGAKVIYQCYHQSLAPLLKRAGGFDQFLNSGEPAPRDIDFWVAGLDLPAALYLDMNELRSQPYLLPEQSFLKKWEERIPKTGRLRVGLRWNGSKDMDTVLLRTLPIEQMQRIADVAGIDFYSFETDSGETLQNVRPLGTELTSWDDTAAALMQMDLLISSCTSVPHLAGALGKPAWVLSSVTPYYMWAPGLEQSPWYQDVKIYQQRAPYLWQPIFDKVLNDLAAFAQAKKN